MYVRPKGTSVTCTHTMAFPVRPPLQYPSGNSSRSRPKYPYGYAFGEGVLCCDRQSEDQVDSHLRKGQLQESPLLPHSLRCTSLFLMLLNPSIQVTLQKCKAQFCASHRFPQDHNCSTPAAQSNSTSRLLDFSTRARDLNLKRPVAGTVAVDVKSITSTTASTSRPVKPSTSSSKLSLPFNKTDR